MTEDYSIAVPGWGPTEFEKLQDAINSLQGHHKFIEELTARNKEFLTLSQSASEMLKNHFLAAQSLGDSLSSILDGGIAQRLADFQKASSWITDFQSEGMRLAESLTKVTQQFSFQRLDAISQLLTESSLAASLKNAQNQLGSDIMGCFNPAVSAFTEWRSSFGDKYLSVLDTWAQPLRERFTTSDVVASFIGLPAMVEVENEKAVVVREIDEHFISSPRNALKLLDPHLLRLWDGAVEAASSTNPDRARHCLVSLRELLTQAIHVLAPDDQISKWSTAREHFHNGRPTRRARILYIMDRVPNGPLKNYMLAEADAGVELFKIFQEGTHGVEPPVTDVQIRVVLRKVQSLICSFVELRTLN